MTKQKKEEKEANEGKTEAKYSRSAWVAMVTNRHALIIPYELM